VVVTTLVMLTHSVDPEFRLMCMLVTSRGIFLLLYVTASTTPMAPATALFVMSHVYVSMTFAPIAMCFSLFMSLCWLLHLCRYSTSVDVIRRAVDDLMFIPVPIYSNTRSFVWM
jgi:hypothetical protein